MKVQFARPWVGEGRSFDVNDVAEVTDTLAKQLTNNGTAAAYKPPKTKGKPPEGDNPPSAETDQSSPADVQPPAA